MNQEKYRDAKRCAEKYAEDKGGLYDTWTQHCSTCQNVFEAFYKRLKELGVSNGSALEPYRKKFESDHGIGDNYY